MSPAGPSKGGKGGKGGKGPAQGATFAEKQVKEAKAELEASRKGNNKLRQQAAEDRKARQAAEAKVADAGKGKEPAADDGEKVEGPGADAGGAASRIKALREKLKAAQAVALEARPYVDGGHGGHAELVAALEKEIEDACSAQREAKPLDARKASADAHLRKMGKLREQAAEKLRKTREQSDALLKKLAEDEAESASVEKRFVAAQQEVASIAEKVAADLRGSPSSAQLLSADAATADEAKLIRDLLKLLSEDKVREASAASGTSGEDALARTKVLPTKLEAQAAPDVLQKQILDMQKRDAERLEALKKLGENMEQDGDSDAESEAPSQAGGEEARKKKRERRARRGAAKKKLFGEVLSKFSAGKTGG